MHASLLRRPARRAGDGTRRAAPAARAAAASTASAHDAVTSSDPASSSRVEQLPEELSITFNAALIGSADNTVVVITDPTGRTVSTGDAEVDGEVVVQQLDAVDAPAGKYTVQWAVVSSDGHPTEGEFFFTTASGSAQASTTPTSLETERTYASTSPAPSPSAPPAAEEPNVEAGASFSVPWIIGGTVVILILLFVVILLVSRRRSS